VALDPLNRPIPLAFDKEVLINFKKPLDPKMFNIYVEIVTKQFI